MKTVYKYDLAEATSVGPNGLRCIPLPINSEPLTISTDLNERLCLWVLVDTYVDELSPFWFHLIWTGEALPVELTKEKYWCTIKHYNSIWHAFRA